MENKEKFLNDVEESIKKFSNKKPSVVIKNADLVGIKVNSEFIKKLEPFTSCPFDKDNNYVSYLMGVKLYRDETCKKPQYIIEGELAVEPGNNGLILEIMEKYSKFMSENSVNYSVGFARNFNKFVTSLKREYGLLPKYPTLREYINENSKGAYHEFVFTLGRNTFTATSASDFELYFRPEILDMYEVINDDKSDNGGNCENYCCTHKLTIQLREGN